MARKAIVALSLALLVGSMGALSACNTMSGAGKDIERGGEKIQDVSKDVQRKM